MITLHQFPRTWDIPNPSPACLAVETYLRMAAIPFATNATRNPGKGPKAKLPVLEDDGEIVTDVGTIFAHLKAKYGDSLDANLDAGARARHHLLQRTFHSNLYWVGLYLRWIDDAGWSAIQAPYFGHLSIVGRWITPPLVRVGMRTALLVQGMGRHSRDEIYAIGSADLTAASTLLGDAPFFGGESPSSIDAIVYGFMANLIWVPIESPLGEHARTLPNLIAHAERIRDRYYAT